MSSPLAARPPSILRTPGALREIVRGWKAAGETVAVVPTMGALHAGHLSLVEAAQKSARRVIVTLFVNPRQFNNAGDLAAYPRTETQDAEKLAPLGVDVLYAPDASAMYPQGFATTVSVAGVSEGLCGAHRPGHFDGMATVVTKLLLQTGADVALFGEKDFQQLQVIRRLAADLDLPVRIIACPTLREADGLAMSSRNLRLDAAARTIAPRLFTVLDEASARLAEGARLTDLRAGMEAALRQAGFGKVEYIELRAEDDFAALEAATRPARLLAAAWLGDVRLIDNVAVTAA